MSHQCQTPKSSALRQCKYNNLTFSSFLKLLLNSLITVINISLEALQKFSCHLEIVIVSLIQGTIAKEQRWICCQLARELLIAYLLKGPFRFYHMLVKGNCIILKYGSGITCSPSLRSVCRLRGKLAEALFYIFVFVYERLTEKQKVGAFLGFNC